MRRRFLLFVATLLIAPQLLAAEFPTGILKGAGFLVEKDNNLQAMKPEHVERDRPGLVGVDHISYTLGSLADLFGNYEYLKTKGKTPYWCIHHGDTVSMYYADPDGNQMEFQVETFEAQRLAPPVPISTPRRNNPIGVEFDPEEWLQRIRSGVPECDFLVRKIHEPISPIRGAFERG
jgi:hypothetical protein